MAIDYTTPIGQIRALIGDTDEVNLELSDEQLQAYYDMAYESILQGAILALRALCIKYNKTSGDMYRVDTIEYQEGKSKASIFKSILDDLNESVKNGTNPLLVGVPHTYGIYVEEYNENVDRMNDGEIIAPRTSNNEYDVIRIKQQGGPYYNG